MVIGDRPNNPELLGCIDRPDLCGLGQAERLGLGVVNIGPLGHQVFDTLRCQLAVLALPQKQLGAIGGVLRAAAFIGFNVGQLVADHAVKRLTDRGQGQRIGGSAIEHEVNVTVGIEQRPQAIRRLLRPAVLTVGRLIHPVGRLHGFPGLRAHTAVVVAGKLLGLGHNALLNSERKAFNVIGTTHHCQLAFHPNSGEAGGMTKPDTLYSCP